MGVTIYVEDYLGEVLLRDPTDMRDLLEAAESLGLPLLTSVDVYDDTRFNRRQSERLVSEVDALSGQRDLTPAIAALQVAISLVGERPHRYLMFNGD
ncbi:hypothetical protein [Nocardioides taihuensis]|uniref:Uncharacterized protein n=1 Tax=Nocardioides taihuensis TaxID=1835606 RepID=A0ABW0BF17_9ACTN